MKTLADEARKIECMPPERVNFTEDEQLALHQFKNAMSDALAELYKRVPEQKADPVILRRFQELVEQDWS